MNTLNSDFRYVIQTNFKHQTGGGWKQFMVKPTLIYTMNQEIYLQAGISFLITDDYDNKIYEVRPWQGINLFYPRIGQLYINNFVRVEERFFAFDYEDENSMGIRARYAIMTRVPLNHNKIIDHTFYLWPYIEAFIPIYEKGLNPDIERFRFSMGLGYRFNQHVRSELVYMYEKSKDEEYKSFTENNNTIRIILRYSLNNGGKSTGL